MKTAIFLLGAVLLLQTPISFAADDECGKAFGLNVANCAQNLDVQFLSPKERSDALKACVETAKIAKEACMSGVNQCLNLCQVTYDSTALACEQNFDPSFCGGNEACEEIILEQRATCLSNALLALNTCIINCQN